MNIVSIYVVKHCAQIESTLSSPHLKRSFRILRLPVRAVFFFMIYFNYPKKFQYIVLGFKRR